jgi:hypothetical protein
MTLKTPVQRALVPVLGGIVAIAALFAVLWGIAVLTTHQAESGGTKIKIGDELFDLGLAESRAGEIARRGPVLYPDLLVGGQRYLWVQHLGDDPLSKWFAFEAAAPGAPLSCATQWDPAPAQFVDPCTGTRFPANGAGLTQYRVNITGDDHVVVNLKEPKTTPAPTSTAPSTSTTTMLAPSTTG